MAGNSADPFGDYTDDDDTYDVSDTEEEDTGDWLDADMSGPDFEDVIPVGHGHWYCLVDALGLERYYQTRRSSSSSTSASTSLPSLPPLLTTSISTPTTHTTQSLAPVPPPAQGTTL